MALRFTYPLNKPPQFDKEVLGKYNDGCPICLRPFSTHDMAIQIIDPRCYHVFGHDCLDTWVQARPTCPLCRLNLLPAPVLVAALPVPRRTLKEIWKKHEDTASRVAFLLAWMLVLYVLPSLLCLTGLGRAYIIMLEMLAVSAVMFVYLGPWVTAALLLAVCNPWTMIAFLCWMCWDGPVTVWEGSTTVHQP